MAWFSRRKGGRNVNTQRSVQSATTPQPSNDCKTLMVECRGRLSDFISARNSSKPLKVDYIELVRKVPTHLIHNISFTNETQVGEFLITHLVLSGNSTNRSNDEYLIHLAKQRLNDPASLLILKQSFHLEIDQHILNSITSQFTKDPETTSATSGLSTTVQKTNLNLQSTDHNTPRTLDQVLSDEQITELFNQARAPYRAQVADAVVWSSLYEALASIPLADTEDVAEALRHDKDRILYRTSRIVDRTPSSSTTNGNQANSFSDEEHQRSIDEILSAGHRAELFAQVRERISTPLDDATVASSLKQSLQSVKLNASTSSQNAMDRLGQKMISKTVAHLKTAEAEYFAKKQEIEIERQRLKRLHEIQEHRMENRRSWEQLSHLHPDGVGDICFNVDELTWRTARISFIAGNDTKKLARSVALRVAENPNFAELDETTKETTVQSALDAFFGATLSPENIQASKALADLSRSARKSVADQCKERLTVLARKHRAEQDRMKSEQYLTLWRSYATEHPGQLGEIGTNPSLALKAPRMNQIAGKALVYSIKSEFRQEQSLDYSTEAQAFKWAIHEIMEASVDVDGRSPEEMVDDVRWRTLDALPLAFRGHLNRAIARRDARESRRLALISPISSSLFQAVLQERNQSTSSVVWLHHDGWWEDLCRQHVGTLTLDTMERISGGTEGPITQTAQYILEMVAAGREVELLPQRTSPTENTGQLSSPTPTFRSLKTPRDFEELSREWMVWLGYADAALTSPGTDGGIDVIARTGVAQVKQYASQVSSPEVQKFAGASIIYPIKDKLFFASTKFSSHAVAFANLPNVKIALFQVVTDRGQQIEPYSLFAQEILDKRYEG